MKWIRRYFERMFWRDLRKSLPTREEVKQRCDELGPILEELRKKQRK